MGPSGKRHPRLSGKLSKPVNDKPGKKLRLPAVRVAESKKAAAVSPQRPFIYVK
jgi:hypothetical protein